MLARNLLKYGYFIFSSGRTMAVSPDLLLNIKAPEPRSKASGAKADSASQASRQEASRFAEMYARERQGKPVERPDAPAKPVRDKPVNETDSQETAGAKDSKEPVVAEGGNDLPLKPEQPIDESSEPAEVAGAELDPLLMFGMGAPAEVAVAQASAKPVGSEFLVGLHMPQAPATSFEAQVLPEEEALAEKVSLPAQAVGGDAVESATKGAERFASMLQAASDSTEATDELELAAVEGDDVEALAETRSLNSELSASRLNPLTQAIAQHVQRPALMPGQPVQMQQSGWSEAVVDRVMWLSSQNLKSAEIQLDPAELGRMEVRIDMTKEQTQVTFLSPHAGVRDALEGQMQRLRDMFAQQGMTMDVNVSDQSLARGWQGDGGGESRGERGGADTDGTEAESAGVMEVASNRSAGDRGLVDFYA